MITIFKDKGDIPKDTEYVELNDLFFNQNTAGRFDERAAAVIAEVDGAKLLGRYQIQSMFGGDVLNIDRLSSGCKTVLNVLYYPEKVFCLKECGNNALEVLYGLENGSVYSDYAMIPLGMEKAAAQTKNGNREIFGYEELKEWWGNEE